MDLIVLFGSGAVGKMTVGQELMKISDFRLFHNHMMIEPVLEIFGKFDGTVIDRLREVVFEEFLKTDYTGLIFTYMWAFDMQSDWDYIRSVAERFEATGGTVYYVELVADRDVRLERNRTANRLAHKASKRDLPVSEARILREESRYRLESLEGEIPFDNYIKIDNTHLEPDEAARMIKARFRLPNPSVKEMMNRIRFEEVREEELPLLHSMQVESFLPLYEKYRDAGSPAIEPIGKLHARMAVPGRKYYFIVKDGARVGAINLGRRELPNGDSEWRISPLFVLPAYQGQGIGYASIEKAFSLHPDAACWRLETIKQEAGNCHLYEKCGFVRTGEEQIVNEKMTLITYERGTGGSVTKGPAGQESAGG